MKILSLFSGIGAFEKALDRLGIDYELVNYCEIDKYASKSYAAIHGVSEDLNLWDVTKVDTDKLPKDIDLVTYGFPCQDISNAGKMRGFTDEDFEKAEKVNSNSQLYKQAGNSIVVDVLENIFKQMQEAELI